MTPISKANMMKIYKCKYPTCFRQLKEPGYCTEHGKLAKPEDKKEEYIKAERKPFETADSPNSELYQSYEWKMLSRRIRERDKVCLLCGATHHLSVHHIQPPKGNQDLFFDDSNLITLCIDCHNKQTGNEVNRVRR